MAKSSSRPDSPSQEEHGSPVGLRDQAAGLLPETVALRRDLHMWPELGNDIPRTRDAVLAALEGLPLEVTTHSTTSGIGALLTGGKPGPTVLLRADMDALPMPEDTGAEYSSRVDNVMHACGHDLHTSMLVGAAKALSARRDEIAGRVLFMFQPGEEGHGGAELMMAEGLLDVGNLADGSPSPVTGAYAIHVTANLPSGTVGLKPGPLMASSDELSITVTGKGGHASSPHFALDPVPIACEIVQALQTMVTRSLDVFDPGVVTVASIHAGTTHNVIPESATILGTMRAISERTRGKVHDGVRRVAEGIAAAHGAAVEVTIDQGYPVTVNDPDAAMFTASVAEAVLGADNVVRMPNPVMGSEDFSYVLHRVPGAMMFLGACPEGVAPHEAPPNHSNRVYFDEDAMRAGVAMYSAMALRHLRIPLS
jgi:hippurate hydrolase